jgi:CheY-like chemotaxis protein
MADENTTAYSIMQALAAALRSGWAAALGATVTVAADPAHALELLTAGRPDGVACVLFYLSDQADGDDMDEDTRVAAAIRVAVIQKPGLKRRDGGDSPAVLEVADGLRNWAASETLTGLLSGGRLRYRGMTHIPTEQGSALHGYALTFEALYAYDVAIHID